MKTEYAQPGLFGLQFGKPVRLPQIRKAVHQTKEESENRGGYSLEKQKQNLKNRTNAFDLFHKEVNMQQGGSSDRQADENGSVIGCYRVGITIGRGSNSTVRVVRHWKGGVYAMKTYANLTQCDGFKRKNMCSEIKILSSLDHPNVLKFVQSVSSPNALHIVTELLDSKSLKSLLRPHQGIPHATLQQITKGVMSALEYLHRTGVAHRDIKLQNVLIGSNNHVKLIDFGFSVSNSQLHYDFCGTPHYIAPEIISKGGYQADKADIWAAGVLFFKLATGDFPFTASNDKLLYRKICKGEYTVPAPVDPMLLQAIQSMLRMDPFDRPTPHDLLQYKWFYF